MWVIVAPRIRMARLWAAEEVAQAADYLSGVLLPYPQELQTPVRRYVEGILDWEELVSRVRSMGLSYVDVWSWTEEPLLRRLRSLTAAGYKLKVECYGPPLREDAEASWEVTRLLLRVRVTGKVDLEAWRRLVGRVKTPVKEGYATLSLKPAEGVKVSAWMYPMPPSDTLSAENLSEESVRALADYVFKYLVATSNPDEAYVKWLSETHRELSEELLPLARALGVLRREELEEGETTG
ncbi:MAG: hypothetical protein QXI84_09180 [Thermofilaceae archaeon]